MSKSNIVEESPSSKFQYELKERSEDSRSRTDQFTEDEDIRRKLVESYKERLSLIHEERNKHYKEVERISSELSQAVARAN
jgi:hypothetical protein